jgi:xanthine/uracil permease
MFGATFVFPAIMGLSPNLAVLMSGVATILFLLIVNGKIPSSPGSGTWLSTSPTPSRSPSSPRTR